MKVVYIKDPYVVVAEPYMIQIGRTGFNLETVAIPTIYGRALLGPDVQFLDCSWNRVKCRLDTPSERLRNILDRFFDDVFNDKEGAEKVAEFLFSHLGHWIDVAEARASKVAKGLERIDFPALLCDFRRMYPGERKVEDALHYTYERVHESDNDGIRYLIRTKFKDFLEEEPHE